MNTLLKHVVWSMGIGLMMWVTMGVAVPTSVQGLSLSGKLQEEIEDRLFESFNSLDPEEKKEVAGTRSPDAVVGLRLIEPTVEILNSTIGNVTTIGAETPLIIAEQYSTNCSSEPLERTFSFSKTKEHSKTVTFSECSRSRRTGVNNRVGSAGPYHE